jgi:hypothetical protein
MHLHVSISCGHIQKALTSRWGSIYVIVVPKNVIIAFWIWLQLTETCKGTSYTEPHWMLLSYSFYSKIFSDYTLNFSVKMISWLRWKVFFPQGASLSRMFPLGITLEHFLGRGISPLHNRYLHRTVQTQKKRRHTRARVEFKPTNPGFEWSKTALVLNRMATTMVQAK